MSKITPHATPSRGWTGIAQHWRSDLIAAFSVSLVALPLGLGIGLASGVPPISGVFSAIIGGLVTTFFRGSHVAINGPTAGLIAVILAALSSLDDGTGQALSYVLAAIVVAGGVQVLLGFFKLGRLAELFPTSVIHGILAAIGVIIFAKQIHIALGSSSDAGSTIGVLLDIPRSIGQLNPFVAIISLISFLLLAFHSRISYKLFHFLPAPMWVLVLAIPFVYLFNFFDSHTIEFMGKSYSVGPSFLIDIPSNPLDSLLFPNFSQLDKPAFWLAVFSITLIGSIESLASAKAVDKLDPYRRKTDLNKDLAAVGLSTMVAGCLGGLPIITVIVRSSVNVNNNAKTRWSNFYHGLLLVVFILLLAPVIQMVPLAALAAILVFTGFRLASPRVFKQAYEQGIEQLLFLAGTLIITLFTDLLWGILGGITLAIGVHILLARLPLPTFFRMIFRPEHELQEKADGSLEAKIKGIANFLTILQVNKLLNAIPDKADVTFDFSEARLVDLTMLEKLETFRQDREESGSTTTISGLDYHIASASHPLALKSMITPVPYQLTPRQQQIKQLAVEHGWVYRSAVDWDISYLRNFQFFETRPIEHKANVIAGDYPSQNIRWEISDLTFDEGAMMATEVYKTTVQVLRLPFIIPSFVLEKEGMFDKIFDRVMAFSGYRDIDFQLFTSFSGRFLLKGRNEKAIREFFSSELIRFLENEDIYHIESNGEALLIFKYLRLARTEETTKMLDFSKALLQHINPAYRN